MVLIGLYVIYMIGKAIFDPKSCPAAPGTAEERAALLGEVFTALLPPLLLIVAVLGSILGGFATPTEAASVGAVGAMLLVLFKGRFNLDIIRAGLHLDRVDHLDGVRAAARRVGVLDRLPHAGR